MKIKNLQHYIENDSDRNIFNALNQSNEEDLNKYIINVTSDLLHVAFLMEEYKTNALNSLKHFSDHEIGEIATYATLTPYVQVSLQSSANWQEKANSFLEMFIAYHIGTITKDEFISNLLQMKKLVGISDKFYNGLIIFFRLEDKFIRNSILDKIK